MKTRPDSSVRGERKMKRDIWSSKLLWAAILAAIPLAPYLAHRYGPDEYCNVWQFPDEVRKATAAQCGPRTELLKQPPTATLEALRSLDASTTGADFRAAGSTPGGRSQGELGLFLSCPLAAFAPGISRRMECFEQRFGPFLDACTSVACGATGKPVVAPPVLEVAAARTLLTGVHTSLGDLPGALAQLQAIARVAPGDPYGSYELVLRSGIGSADPQAILKSLRELPTTNTVATLASIYGVVGDYWNLTNALAGAASEFESFRDPDNRRWGEWFSRHSWGSGAAPWTLTKAKLKLLKHIAESEPNTLPGRAKQLAPYKDISPVVLALQFYQWQLYEVRNDIHLSRMTATHRALMEAACAALIYRQKQGKWPESMPALKPWLGDEATSSALDQKDVDLFDKIQAANTPYRPLQMGMVDVDSTNVAQVLGIPTNLSSVNVLANQIYFSKKPLTQGTISITQEIHLDQSPPLLSFCVADALRNRLASPTTVTLISNKGVAIDEAVVSKLAEAEFSALERQLCGKKADKEADALTEEQIPWILKLETVLPDKVFAIWSIPHDKRDPRPLTVYPAIN